MPGTSPIDVTASTSYLHYDNLGSVDAITDDQGNVIQQMSFDATGIRRDPSNWDYDLTQTEITALGDYTDRGYTSQEELDNVELVHMNGRIYDPTIGRFISADPRLSNIYDSQLYNRYSYTSNNLLGETDPTGFDTEVQLGKIKVVGIAINYFEIATSVLFQIDLSLDLLSSSAPNILPPPSSQNGGSPKQQKNKQNKPCDQTTNGATRTAGKTGDKHISTGVVVAYSTINPLTSSGGESWGNSMQSISDSNSTYNAYNYSGTGAGIDVGLSIQSVWAYGSGTWTGQFNSVSGNAGLFSAAVFWTPGSGGYIGFSFGLGVGFGGSYTTTKYVCR